MESNSYKVTAGRNGAVFAGFVAQDMQALPLTDLDISNWKRQIIYLDFDGGHNVTCDSARDCQFIQCPCVPSTRRLCSIRASDFRTLSGKGEGAIRRKWQCLHHSAFSLDPVLNCRR